MAVYLALGDSISIDDYTGVRRGGAPSQLARKLGLDLIDLTSDGNTTQGVLTDLARAPAAADVVTLTAGGNDLLLGHLPLLGQSACRCPEGNERRGSRGDRESRPRGRARVRGAGGVSGDARRRTDLDLV
jgi:lysophospholipase L1-like esterase